MGKEGLIPLRSGAEMALAQSGRLAGRPAGRSAEANGNKKNATNGGRIGGGVVLLLIVHRQEH
jgi:hypothetical protein